MSVGEEELQMDPLYALTSMTTGCFRGAGLATEDVSWEEQSVTKMALTQRFLCITLQSGLTQSMSTVTCCTAGAGHGGY